MISSWKVKKLEALGQDFRCPFNLPPFNRNTDEGAFDINEFKDSLDFQKFLTHINSLDIKYEYTKHNDRMFMVIKIDE